MSPQRKWHFKMMGLFWAFVGGSVLLPFLPFSVPGGCLFKKLFGIPCLGCGIRSSIAALVHGNYEQALVYNPAGPFVLFVCVLFAGYFTYAALMQRSLPWNKEVHIFKLINLITFNLLSLQWGYRLFIS